MGGTTYLAFLGLDINPESSKHLWSFKEDLILPVHGDKFEHVDYVPTQVFTEYIRYLYHDSEGSVFDGIIYPSSKHFENQNIVIFCERQNCIEIDGDVNANPHIPKYLRLIEFRDVDNRDYDDYMSSLC